MVLHDFFVRHNSEFLGYNLTTGQPDVGVTVLLQLRDDGSAKDNFRVHVYGNSLLQITIAAEAILDIPEAKGVYLFYQCSPEDTEPGLNRTASTFIDLEAGLKDTSFLTCDEHGAQVMAYEF